MATKVKKALDTIQAAMQADSPEEPGSYAHSWHCAVAMSCYDAILAADKQMGSGFAHKVGNDAASRFMKMCFDVETRR